jgi:hypothetical protein
LVLILLIFSGIPSTIYNGVLPPKAVPKPLIITDGVLPVNLMIPLVHLQLYLE